MCFGSSKTPSIPSAPAPAPTPSPAPSQEESAVAADVKRNKIAALRFGAISTIRNVGGAPGVSGAGADLSNPMAQAGQKKTIGA